MRPCAPCFTSRRGLSAARAERGRRTSKKQIQKPSSGLFTSNFQLSPQWVDNANRTVRLPFSQVFRVKDRNARASGSLNYQRVPKRNLIPRFEVQGPQDGFRGVAHHLPPRIVLDQPSCPSAPQRSCSFRG